MKRNLGKNMRAKFIKESLDFERGQDPKRSMGIGNEAHRVASELGIDMAELRSLWGIIGYLEPEMETGEDAPDKDDFAAHVWMIADDPGSWGVEKDSHFYEVIEWANHNVDDAWKIFNLDHNEVYEIHESRSFKRGRDPKHSIGIGKIASSPVIVGENTFFKNQNKKLSEDEIKRILRNPTKSKEENIAFNVMYPGEESPRFFFLKDLLNSNETFVYDGELYDFSEYYKMKESYNFERGKDPKSAMDIGMEPRTFHVGSVRYNRGSTTYLDKKLAKRVLRGEDTIYQNYFVNAPGHDNTKGFYIEELQDSKNPYFYIEYDGEIYPVIGKINESVSFERGKDPKDSLKIGLKSRAFPIESVYSGAQWVKGEELKLFLESVLNSNMGGFPEYAQSVRFKKDPNLKTLISEIWHIYELINMGFSGILWNDIFVPFYKPDLKENLEFERGQDPKKAMGIGRVRPYPGMSPKEFANWFEEEILTYGNPGDWGAMVDNLFNNDWETDQEVSIYLIDRNMDPELVRELIEMREYFNDSKYLNAIKNSWMDEI
jgi:hypothetical protein